MAIKDYDAVIDMIEDNITIDSEELSKKASRLLGLDKRRASEFFQNIDSERRTLTGYIRDRKNLRALGDCAAGGTKEAICEKYNIGTINFYRSIKALFPEKTMADFRNEKYTCPPPVHVADILKDEGIAMEIDHHEKDTQKEYIVEIQRLIDENEQLKKVLSAEKAKVFKENVKSIEQNFNINSDTYRKFLELEDARIIYGFSISEILHLYRQSLRSKKSFEELCSEAHASYYFERKRAKHDAPFSYFNLTDELDAGEAWNLYFGDDDPADLPPDPYAPTDEEIEAYDNEFVDGWDENDYMSDGVTEEEQRRIDKAVEEIEREMAKSEAKKNEKQHRPGKLPLDQKKESAEETIKLSDDDIPF